MPKELGTCCFCGNKYEGYGNSTWGWWQMHGSSPEDDATLGEKHRCCDNCNYEKVTTARMYLISNHLIKNCPEEPEK